MKFGIKCLQENSKERHYSKNYFFRYKNNTAAETATIYDTIFILQETIWLQTTVRFSDFHQILKKYGKFSAGWAA